MLKEKKPSIEIIITGRDEISEIISLADYVTFLEEKKHPFQKGILARPGIEY